MADRILKLLQWLISILVAVLLLVIGVASILAAAAALGGAHP